jgi:hypothetical protein
MLLVQANAMASAELSPQPRGDGPAGTRTDLVALLRHFRAGGAVGRAMLRPGCSRRPTLGELGQGEPARPLAL